MKAKVRSSVGVIGVVGIAALLFFSGISRAESPRVSIPIGAGHVELNESFAFAGGVEVGAFVPTGSGSDRCLLTLSESDFAISGTTVYCGLREVGGQLGIFIHVFLPVPAPQHFVMSLTVYQELAMEYGQPVPFV
ncbi:MAG: hypothetical protein ACRDHS_08370 [Actinomycetota bacterium]